MTVITSNNIPKISLKIRKLLVMKTLSCSMDLLTICNYMTNRQLYSVIVYNYLTAFFNEFTWCNSGKAGFVASNGAMKSAVTNDPYAIGYVSVGYMDASVSPVTLDNVTPTLDTVRSGRYKIARGLFSNTKGPATGLAKKFIDFLLSPEGQKITAQKGFIPVN